MAVFFWASIAVLLGSQIALLTGLTRVHQSWGLDAVSYGLFSVGAIREGDHLVAGWFAALCALAIWEYWTGGGGDGTRRRLRSLARAFRGVRRTAPVTGGAS